jgi:hypothetical protein
MPEATIVQARHTPPNTTSLIDWFNALPTLYPPKADIPRRHLDVRFGPTTEVVYQRDCTDQRNLPYRLDADFGNNSNCSNAFARPHEVRRNGIMRVLTR